jgi:transposase
MASSSDDHSIDWRAEALSLRSVVAELSNELKQVRDEVAQLRRDNTDLRNEVVQLRRRVLGPTSEKMPPISSEVRRKQKRKKKDGKAERRARASRRRTVETEQVFHPVPDAQRCCPHCDRELVALGKPEESVEYEFVPARFVRRVHQREKLCCPRCKDHIVLAPVPPKVFDKSQYGPGFIGHLITAKCADALPLYRQAKQLERVGVPIARSTMTDLFHRAAAILAPLYSRMLALIREGHRVLADETSFRVQDKGQCRRGFIWTFINGGLIAYLYSPDRSGETPSKLLGGTPGTLLCDGYTGYNNVCEVDGRTRAGCLAHMRRKFFEAKETAPDEAKHALDVVTEIYAIEHDVAEAGQLGTDAHRRARQTRSRPVMTRFKQWLAQQKPLHPPKSPMATAIGYALNQWKPLAAFLDDPGLPPDNNESERRLRLIALGRKNYLFAGHDVGAQNLAMLMSLVVSCEANGVNPQQYLADVLLRVQDHPAARIDDLLPTNWAPLAA